MKRCGLVVFSVLFLLLSASTGVLSQEKPSGEGTLSRADADRIDTNHKGFKFRDILIGVKLADQMVECRGAGGKVCYEKAWREGSPLYQNCYNVHNLPELGFIRSTMVCLVDGDIERIDSSVFYDGADELLSLLRTKYGNPHTFTTSVIQNRMGAKFERYIAVWNVKECELLLVNRLDYVDKGSLIIKSQKYKKQEVLKNEDKARQDLDKL